MWVFTRYGFYSVSALPKTKKQKNDRVLVRARLRRHLEELQKRFPDQLGKLDLVTSPRRDYRYRIVVAKEVWASCLYDLSMEQDWSNFKSESERYERMHKMPTSYVDALHTIWSTMFRVQAQEHGKHAVLDADFFDVPSTTVAALVDVDDQLDQIARIENQFNATKTKGVLGNGDSIIVNAGHDGEIADETDGE